MKKSLDREADRMQQLEQEVPKSDLIWKLVPVDVKRQKWEASIFKGELIVRAKDAGAARRTASGKYSIATRGEPGQESAASPWNDPNTVSCKRIDDARYEAEGPSAILQRKEIF